jgi:hypothetical protein
MLTIASLVLSSFAASSAADSAQNKTISKKELKVLLTTAKEPAEHRKIAEYYRQQAQRLSASSKQHAQMAEIYAKDPVYKSRESKTGDTAMGANHCRKWAKLEAEEAKEAESLAALHENMAKAAEQKQ